MITANDIQILPHAGGPGLSIRQRQVLNLAAQGLTRRQIAQRLGLRHHTVNEHLKQVYRKLGVHNRVGAVTLAIRQGLIETTRAARRCPHCGCQLEMAGRQRDAAAGGRPFITPKSDCQCPAGVASMRAR